MVTESAARMLLYQTLLPCTPQGEVLRRAIMSHELRSISGHSPRCLVGTGGGSENKLPPAASADSNSAAGDVEEGGCTNEAEEGLRNHQLFHAVWSGEELLTMAREVSVRKSGAQVEVCGQVTSDADFGRILVFLLDCVDDVLPGCTVRLCDVCMCVCVFVCVCVCVCVCVYPHSCSAQHPVVAVVFFNGTMLI